MKRTLTDLQRLAELLSEVPRIRILHLLLVKGKMAAGDLDKVLNLNQTLVSRHLRYFRDANMVETERRPDNSIFYSLVPESEEILHTWFGPFMREDATLLADVQQFEEMGKKGLLKAID